MKKSILKRLLLLAFLFGFSALSAQSNLAQVRVYAKSALQEYVVKYYTLKKIHSVVIEDWSYNSHTGRYIIIFKGKWEDVGIFFDDVYEYTYTLKCDYDGCNATIQPESSSTKTDLECLEK